MEHVYQRRVAFADTDAAGVVHFSRILCYVEEAEHSLLSELGIPLMDGGGWPRVHVECEFLAPIKPGYELEVVISPAQLGNSSVTWQFSVIHSAQTMAQGKVKSLRVDHSGKPVELHPSWREALTR